MPIHNPEMIEIQDEGVSKGFVRTVNYVGAGVTAAAAANVGTITIPGGGSAGELLFNKHVITADITVTAGYTVYVPRYVEINAGVTLEIGADADLEIG